MIIYDYLLCLFLLLSGFFCVAYGVLHWKATNEFLEYWISPILFRRLWALLAIAIGCYHLLFGVMKAIYTTMELFQ